DFFAAQHLCLNSTKDPFGIKWLCHRATHCKMDIEGSHRDALRTKPGLAESTLVLLSLRLGMARTGIRSLATGRAAAVHLDSGLQSQRLRAGLASKSG
ncbi:MAG: hypothetical protein ABWX87_12720, partial [Pseudoxanthomonas sp.]